jgi:hypothetical protein
MKTSASARRLPHVLALMLLGTFGVAHAAYFCQDSAGRKVMSDRPCEDEKVIRNTGGGERDNTPAWRTQARKDRCNILIQKANSPTKVRAYTELCAKPLSDAKFSECSAQIEYSNSASKMAAAVATCTSDIDAAERITPPSSGPVIVVPVR